MDFAVSNPSEISSIPEPGFFPFPGNKAAVSSFRKGFDSAVDVVPNSSEPTIFSSSLNSSVVPIPGQRILTSFISLLILSFPTTGEILFRISREFFLMSLSSEPKLAINLATSCSGFFEFLISFSISFNSAVPP